MFLYEFNTDKMTWTKTAITTNPGTCYVNIKINDDAYFKELLNVFYNLRNKKYRLILVDHTVNRTFFLDSPFIIGWDVINDNPKLKTLTKETLQIAATLLVGATSLTDINNYWLYLQYE